MKVNRMIVCGLAAFVLSVAGTAGATAPPVTPVTPATAEDGAVRLAQAGGKRGSDQDTEQKRRRQPQRAQPQTRSQTRETTRETTRDTTRDRIRRAQPDSDAGARRVPGYESLRRSNRNQAQRKAAPERNRVYERERTQDWNRNRPAAARPVIVPGRWVHHDVPRHRNLHDRHYGRIWWCDRDCHIVFLFGFTIWVTDLVLSEHSAYAWPVWESLEYNRTGEISLWESTWGYVEFTITRTYSRHFRTGPRPCRDFTRVVVRHDGWEKRYHGTACRNLRGEWWIVS